jgi:hypothetical protein
VKKLAKNQILVYFSCFIYLEKNISCANPERITWIQQDIPMTMTKASGTTLLNQNKKLCADTLHVVGSWYDPTTCKYRRRKRARNRSEKKKPTFDHFVRSQAAGGAQDGQNAARN